MLEALREALMGGSYHRSVWEEDYEGVNESDGRVKGWMHKRLATTKEA